MLYYRKFDSWETRIYLLVLGAKTMFLFTLGSRNSYHFKRKVVQFSTKLHNVL